MAKRERMCAQCGRQFSYNIARGNDRRYCGDKACMAEVRKHVVAEGVKGKTCAVADCIKPPRAVGSDYCEMHYGRLRRSGTLNRTLTAHHLHRPDGYVRAPAPKHPMALGSSHAYEHRVAFFDAHGPGPHACHVCGKVAMLAQLHVDHVNDVRNDNRIENLKPACPPCNQYRTQSRAEICRRKRTTRLIEFGGERLSRSEWARRVGISPSSLAVRLANGWPLQRALTEGRGITGPRAQLRA